MACKEYSERLDLFEDYLDGRLDGATVETVRAHLDGCATCREEVESAKLAGVLLRVALEPTAEPDEFFWTRVRAHLHEEEEKERVNEFWPAAEWLARRLTLTGAIALVVLFVFLAAAPQKPPIAASSQTEIREIFPESVRQPANSNEVLMSLATNGNGR